MKLLKKLRGTFNAEEKGPAQRAGEKIDRVTEKAVAKVKRGVDTAGDKVVAAGKKLKNSVK